MLRFLNMLSRRVIEDPVSILYHYLCGRMVDYINGPGGPVHWSQITHRGVQWLHKVEFPRKQKRYIFSPLFQIKFDTAFEETIRACSDRGPDEPTWVAESYIRGMCKLHEMGYAHSFEAWHEGKLVGGAFGVQLGALMTVDSMFHRMSNASKAAYGQTLVRLQERGFKIVDTNGVAQHQVNYGEEWMPHWQFQKLLVEMLAQKPAPTLLDDRPYPSALPWEIRTLFPLYRLTRPIVSRLRGKQKAAAAPAAGAPASSQPGNDPPPVEPSIKDVSKATTAV